MKKKIALFLAFSMMLSILPLNVFARYVDATVAPLPFGGHTGSLLQRNQGPATNLRHMEDGTLVGLSDHVSAVLADNSISKNYVGAPVGNMRDIVFGGEYFSTRNYTTHTVSSTLYPGSIDKPILRTSTSIVMDIHNVEMWLGNLASINTKESVEFPIYTNTSHSALATSVISDTTTRSTANLTGIAETLSVGGEVMWGRNLLEEYYENRIWELVTDPNILLTTSTVEPALAEYLRLNYNTDSLANIKDFLDAYNPSVYVGYATPGNTGAHVGDISLYGLVTVPAGTLQGSVAWNNLRDEVATLINDVIKVNAKAYQDSIADTVRNLSQTLFNSDGTRRDVLYSGIWVNAGTEWQPGVGYWSNPWQIDDETLGIIVTLVDEKRAEILMWRNDAFNDVFINNPNGSGVQAVPYFSIPIEYVTNGDSNDNPIYLTFQAQSVFGDVGETNRRTDLTVNSDSRFIFSLKDDPRVFHRYGRGEITGIRIEEAVQEAFDQRDWWIEFEIVTPGFYWTQDSIDRLNRANSFSNISIAGDLTSTRYDNLSMGRDIRNLSFPGTALRTPNEGSSRFTQVAFPITLEGQTNIDRYVNDWFQINNLSIGATDRARPGDVKAEIRLYRRGLIDGTNGWWQWNPAVDNAGKPLPGSDIPLTSVPTYTPTPGTNNSATAVPPSSDTLAQTNGQWLWIQAVNNENYGRAGDPVDDGELVVAKFGEVGLELFIHEDDDVEDFQLRSGLREWDFVSSVPVGESRPIGAIIPESSRMEYHKTARAVLRETAPGSLPATGAHPTYFHFPEGIQLLGAKIWANDAAFSADHNDDNEQIWFGNEKMEADNYINTTIELNSVVVRPEIGVGEEDRRWKLAQITAEFYLSVQPGYESLYGEDIDVKVVSGTVEAPFEGTLTVAYAWDPIQVTTQNIVLDENDIEAAQGIVRGIPLSDITITETRSGELMPGQRIWIGLEGGIGRAWNQADSQSITATSVEIRGDTQFSVSPISLDSHGFYVEVIRASREDGAQIVFSGVEASGRVVPDNQYHLIVADTAASHNWEGWGWIHNQAADVGFTRGVVRGFFNDEPYLTPMFRFEGAEIYAPPPTTIPGQVTPPEPNTPAITGPVTVGEWMLNFQSFRVPGRTIEGPPLILVPNLEDPNYATSYVMFAVVADLLGIQGTFDDATRTGTFSNGTTTVLVTNGSTTATVNGTQREIRTARTTARPNGLLADARIIGDRFYVPITFFRDVVPEFPITMVWNDAPAGSRSITVTPR